METGEKFEMWAVVEMFGHTVIAGLVTEQNVGGVPFVRVDVPEVDGKASYTKLLGNGAIYAITPCSEEAARLVVQQRGPRPIPIYLPELEAISARSSEDGPFDEDELDF